MVIKATTLDDTTVGTVDIVGWTVRRLEFGAMRISGAAQRPGRGTERWRGHWCDAWSIARSTSSTQRTSTATASRRKSSPRHSTHIPRTDHDEGRVQTGQDRPGRDEPAPARDTRAHPRGVRQEPTSPAGRRDRPVPGARPRSGRSLSRTPSAPFPTSSVTERSGTSVCPTSVPNNWPSPHLGVVDAPALGVDLVPRRTRACG